MSSSHVILPAPSQEIMGSDEKWKRLFSDLLGKRFHQLDLEVKVGDKELELMTSSPNLAEQITQMFNTTPEGVRARLSYTLKDLNANDSVPLSPSVTYPPAVKLTPEVRHDVYEKLFGKKILRRYGQINWNEEEEKQEEKKEDPSSLVLQGSCRPDDEFDVIQLNKHIAFLKSASLEELRRALTDNSQYQALPESEAGEGFLKKHISKILYLQKDSTNIFLDLGLLFQCVIAPEMEVSNAPVQGSAAQQFKVKINKKWLLIHLNSIFPENFVLHLNDEVNAAQQQAQPILLSSIRRATPYTNVVTLILDCSGSMGSHREAYLEHVKDFLRQLIKEYPDYQKAIINIVPFSKGSRLHSFNLAKFTTNEKRLNALEACLNTLYMGGGTALFSTVQAQLSLLLAAKEEIHTVIIFTDGVDNQSPGLTKIDLQTTTAQLSQKQGVRPQIFAYGLGEELDMTKLEELAGLSGGRSTQLKSINDFKSLLNCLVEMGLITEYKAFVQDNIINFVVPSFENDLSVAANSLTVPGEFSVDGKTYAVAMRKDWELEEAKEAKSSATLPPISPALSTGMSLSSQVAEMSEKEKNDLLELLLRSKYQPSVQSQEQKKQGEADASINLGDIYLEEKEQKTKEYQEQKQLSQANSSIAVNASETAVEVKVNLDIVDSQTGPHVKVSIIPMSFFPSAANALAAASASQHFDIVAEQLGLLLPQP